MVGRTVSPCRIDAKLGEGGMGEVYLAEDTSLGRRVALKFPPEAPRADPITRKRFLREARSAAALDHPNICKVYEVARTEEGFYFIAMELLEGETLRAMVSPADHGQRGGIEAETVASLVSRFVDGIQDGPAAYDEEIKTSRGQVLAGADF